MEIQSKPLTQNEVDKYKDLINSTNRRIFYNESITNIILEEAQSYFAGDKNVDEASEIIQSRVTTYINENR